MTGEESREPEIPSAPEMPSLEKRVKTAGRRVGDRYVRIVRPVGTGIRGHGGRYVATEETMESTGRLGRAWQGTLRALIGRRLQTEA